MSARASLVSRASMSAQPVSLLCQYSTGILSPREEGGEGRGGRTEEGGREKRRGEERGGKEGEQMSVVRGSCGPLVIEKNVCVPLFCAIVESCVSGLVEGVFTGMQQSTVKVRVSGLSCCPVSTQRYSV